jgi:hypothetical protein
MTRRWLGPLPWFALVVTLTGTLLLVARLDVETPTAGESSVSERLTALVSCILPASAADPPAPPAGVDLTAPGCASATPDPVRSAWMTAC